MPVEQVLTTEETLVWTVEVRRDKLKMSILKFSGMSKWSESQRGSGLLTEAWRSPCGGENQRHWSSPGWEVSCGVGEKDGNPHDTLKMVPVIHKPSL